MADQQAQDFGTGVLQLLEQAGVGVTVSKLKIIMIESVAFHMT